MIDRRLKIIFVHIPRTSGTSIELALGAAEGNTKHFDALKIKGLVGDRWDKYFKFSIVRNPWDRAVSLWAQPAFRDIGKLSENSLESFLMEYSPRPNEYGVTFEDYLNFGEMDFVARFENREQDLKKISDRIGVNIDPEIHTKKTDRLSYKEYHTPTTIQMVWDIWGQDAEKYGYSYES